MKIYIKKNQMKEKATNVFDLNTRLSWIKILLKNNGEGEENE